MSSKSCFKCKITQPLTEYYKHAQMGDGHLNKCKSCTKKDMNKTRNDNLDKHRERDRKRFQTSDRKVYQAARLKQWKQRSPEKTKAHTLVNNALKNGRLVRPLKCEMCLMEKKLQGHHDDYFKPLDVRWLCFVCHRKVHGQYKDKE